MGDEFIVGVSDRNAIRILSASAVRQAITGAAEAFHKRSNANLHLQFATSGAVEKRIATGEVFDVVAASIDALSALHERALLGAPSPVGSSRIALGVKDGVNAPDISTVDKFRAALLAAKHIARGDPDGGGTAGNHLHRVLERTGLLDVTRDKTILRVGGYNVMKEVVEDRADFGLTQSTEIVAVDGVGIAGWLPDDLQLVTTYAVAKGLGAPLDERAKDLYASLIDGSCAGIYTKAGFFPS
ncbi:substrate-binding domain-containing protein [Roseiarcaceae bacterium H3SJ34-1]|uniref:substrate-binding domain-containing protein n=1 Tax=Terripilifer ovatus TaxID=3032367 RepID=UPI003AB938EE|nr:substrate-binding domain-containing protein [Roseiarcaceae bacterium H3SJ34-1]